MVDTRVQRDIEKWIREQWMPIRFGESFRSCDVKLAPGGKFEFDAVNDDVSIVACISTSTSRTASNRFATGKFMKLRSDMLFLSMIEKPCRKIMILVDAGMHAECLKQQNAGRTPKDIVFVQSDIPDELHRALVEARKKASREVTPQMVEDEVPDEVLLDTVDGGVAR